MTLSLKVKLPDTYIGELGEYQRISQKYNRTTTGSASYTNPDTSASYNVSSGGEEALANLLYNTDPILKNYILDDSTYEVIRDAINQSLETLTPSSGTSTSIVVTIPSDYSKFLLEIPTTITGGNITINGLPLYEDYALTTQVTELESGIYTIFDKTTAFYLAPSSSGDKSFTQEYDGANQVLLDSKLKEISIKQGDYIEGEFYELFINDGGTGQVIPPLTQVTPVSKEPVGTATPVDKSTPVQVVNADYDVGGNGGRKVVVLDNGWVVSVLDDATTPKWYVDKQDGNGFIQLAFSTFSRDRFSITSIDKILSTLTPSTVGIQEYRFDVESTTGQYDTVSTVDSGQSSVGTVSSITDLKGITHEAHVSKNATYPNSFNIRYDKDDGEGNWGSVEQVTNRNTSGIDYTKPSIQENGDNVVIFARLLATTTYVISLLRNSLGLTFTSDVKSGWSREHFSDADTYVKDNPSSHRNGDAIACSWQAYGASHISTFHIYFASTDDNGDTITTPIDVAVGENPSLTRDINGNWVVTYERGGTIYSKTSADSWTAETTVATGTNPQTAIYPYFTEPLTVFDGGTDVQFTGVWDSYSEFETIGDNKAIIDGTLEMYNPVLGQVYNGHVSKVNRWLPSMEGGNNKLIKNIQHIDAIIPSSGINITVPISSVDLNHSAIRNLTFEGLNLGAPAYQSVRAKFSDESNVLIERGLANSTEVYVSLDVVEYSDDVDVQFVEYSATNTTIVPISPVSSLESAEVVDAGYNTNFSSNYLLTRKLRFTGLDEVTDDVNGNGITITEAHIFVIDYNF